MFKVFRTIGALRAQEALRTWLYRVARGTALNHLRDDSARAHAEHVLEESDTRVPGGLSFRPDQAIDLHTALDRLDRRHREVLVLLFLEGLTVREIAEVVGVPPGTVKSRVHYAKQAIVALLEGCANA